MAWRPAIFSFDRIDIIILAVTLESVPEVVEKLSKHEVGNVVLMLDTPVLPHTKLGARKNFKHFKQVIVSEDNLGLPLYQLVKKLIDEDKIGKVKKISFFYSGYRYHALAVLRMLTGAGFIKKIKQTHLPESKRKREIHLPGGIKAEIYEPRDYKTGKFLVEGERGKIADFEAEGNKVYRIEYEQKNGVYQGLKLNGELIDPDELEKKYLKNLPDNLFDNTRMTLMKIVGFMKLLNDVKNNKKLWYRPEDGIYDHLAIKVSEKFGYFRDFSTGVKRSSIFYIVINILSLILKKS